MLNHRGSVWGLFCGTVAVVAAAGGPAAADVIVNFTGVVHNVLYDDAGIFPGVAPGDPVAGSFSYDANTSVFAQTSPTRAFYLTGAISIQIGALSFNGDGSFRETIIFNDDQASDGTLSDGVRIDNSFDCGDINELAITLVDEDATVFNDAALPIVVPGLNEFESRLDAAQVACTIGATESFLSITILSMSQETGDGLFPAVPTVSAWGMLILTLLVVAGQSIRSRAGSKQRRATQVGAG